MLPQFLIIQHKHHQGHDWTCTIPSGSSFLSLSSTTGNYHPNGDGKLGGSSDPGDSSVTINFTDNNTGVERGGLILLEDDTSGQTHELRVFQPTRKLTTFSITSNQARYTFFKSYQLNKIYHLVLGHIK